MMKRFSFSLETLLDIKKINEDKIMQELALKNKQIYETETKLYNMKLELEKFQKEEFEKRINGENIDNLRYSVEYRNTLKLRMIEQGKKIDELYRELNFIKKKLSDATKERKMLETLKDKKFIEWKKKLNKTEVAVLDDISQRNFIRNKGVSH